MKIFSIELTPVYMHNLDQSEQYKVNDHIVTLACTTYFALDDPSWKDIYLSNVGNLATNIIAYKMGGINKIDTELSNKLYSARYFNPMNRPDINTYFSWDSEIEWGVNDINREVFVLKRKLYFALGDFLTDMMTDHGASVIKIKRSMAHKYQLRFETKSIKHHFPICLYTADFHRDFEALASKVAMEILYSNRKLKARVKKEHLIIDRTLKFEPEVDSRKCVIKFYVKSPLKFFLRRLTGMELGKEYEYALGHIDPKVVDSKFLVGKFKL